MAKKLFSIRFTNYVLHVDEVNPALHLSSEIKEDELIKRIDEILLSSKLKYVEGNNLSYHYNEGALIVTGVANTISPGAHAGSSLMFSS